MINESYIFSPLLFAPKYRVWRFLFFAVVGIIITFNMTFIAYQDCSSVLGNRIYLICLSSFTQYIVAMLLNYYYLIPKFLLKGRYVAYTILLTVIVFLLPSLAVWQEYWVRSLLDLPHRITSYTSPLILVDNLASCLIISICFLGMSFVVLLRQWVDQREQMNRMELEQIQSEVNKLKGQITPAFLSKTLKNASRLVKTNAKKATGMLMQLGLLLRYQLYDCNRDRVLLKSEISFLENFLRLEQMNREEFQFEIRTEGNLNNVFVAPLLLISLLQKMTRNSTWLGLSFALDNDSLIFRCISDYKERLAAKEMEVFARRLELLYPGNNSLTLDEGVAELKINMTE